jgi:hypothetical protein
MIFMPKCATCFGFIITIFRHRYENVATFLIPVPEDGFE